MIPANQSGRARWRICFCNSTRFWGGGEHWHLEFARRMSERGHDTFMLAAKASELEARATRLGVDVTPIHAGRLGFLNPLLMARLYTFFRAKRPHAVILGLPQDLKAAGQAARLAGVPAVLYRRGMGLPVRDTVFNRHLYRNVAHGVIVNAEDTRRTLFARNPHLLPQTQVHLLPNGIPASWCEGPTPPPTKGALVIGTAGRLVEQKGHRLLLDAAAQLKKRGVAFELRIAGQGPLQKALQQQAAACDITDNVRYLGFVENMQAFYDELDVFAFPSLWEGMGNAVLEAMGRARPVVGFAISSMPEVVRHTETGLLAPAEGDDASKIQGLAHCLESLANDAPQRILMGQAARTRILQDFRQETIEERFEDILRALLASAQSK